MERRHVPDWFRRTLIRLLLGVLILVVIAGAGIGYWIWSGRFVTVHEGNLYRSAEMSPDSLIRTCRRHGIVTVVDFRKAGEDVDAEAEALTAAGIRHVHLPSSQVPSPDVVKGFLDLADDPKSHPMLIHCEHGIGRAGVLSAVYRMEYQGWDNERARTEARWLSGFDSFSPDSGKGKFLRSYVPRARRDDTVNKSG